MKSFTFKLTGKQVCSNSEGGTGKIVVGSRPHKLGRVPLHIGAFALIYPSGRQNLFFDRLFFHDMTITHEFNEQHVRRYDSVGMSRYFANNYVVSIEQPR